jgi:hypothetical protein
MPAPHTTFVASAHEHWLDARGEEQRYAVNAQVKPVALVEELTPAWLSAALGRTVTAVDARAVGTGQMGTCYRLRLTGDPALPATVLAKLPTTDAGTREFLAGSYGTEVGFYRDLAATVAVGIPTCAYAGIGEKGVFTLLLEDLAPSEPGDQIRGCTAAQAWDAVVNLAGLHGPRWSDPTLLDVATLSLPTVADGDLMDETFPGAIELTLELLGDLVSAEDAATLRAVAPLVGRWVASRPAPYALVHGDYRLDNLLFPPAGPGVRAVDWQSVSVGLPARDVAFFLGTGLTTRDRRAHEQDLLAAYHTALADHGVTDYSFAQCWEDYCYGMLQVPLIVGYGCAYAASRTERGNRMFAAMIERGCAAIRDLGTLAALGV